MDNNKEYMRWCARVTDPAVKSQLGAMAGKQDQIDEAFYTSLSFGTAGLRGILGAGTNRMNIYTVGHATQGIATYMKAQGQQERGVAICYDSRINSELFAHTAASVLAANGIPSHVYPRLEPTPALSFATRELGCFIGINITASHNPAAYNGYKVYGPDGCQITDEICDGIVAAIAATDIFDDVRTMDFEQARKEGLVKFIDEAVLDAFLDAVYAQSVQDASEAGDLRVVYTPLCGTGLECVGRILEKIGVNDVHVVPEQAKPDGHFPTCEYPNPEKREALEKAIELAEQVHPDLVLATDPDTDRVGIAVKDGDEYQLLTGNEVGVLLLDYLCGQRLEKGTMPENPVAVTTIVSTSMADAVAAHYGVEMRRVLTGFKYIGGVIADLEAQGHPERFVMGFEESYGYLVGTHARDKDAVVASMLICEMARYHRACGRNLYQAMQELYARFGYYINETLSFEFAGIVGAERMAYIMESLRSQAPSEIAGLAVERVKDYQSGIDGLPSANVIEFELAGGHKAIVRPSGTEPKVKVYVFACGETAEAADGVRGAIASAMSAYME